MPLICWIESSVKATETKVSVNVPNERCDRDCPRYGFPELLRSTTNPHLKNIGILATEGTLKTELWQNELFKIGITTVTLPNSDQVEYFNNVEYGRNGIKAGSLNSELKNKLFEGCSSCGATHADGEFSRIQ